MDYYLRNKEWFEKTFWSENHDCLLLPNGIFSDEQKDLEVQLKILLELIKRDGKIIDLGCGNGLLLKLLILNSKQKIIPYGIDFLEKSIKQAKEIVFPEFKDNFHVGNVVDYKLEDKFDYIITDPVYVSDEDVEYYYEKCFGALEKDGILIFYMPPDSLRNIIKRSRTLPFLKIKGIKWVKFPPMLFGYISNTK